MSIRNLVTLIFLTLGLAACGQGGESGSQEAQKAAAESREGARDSEPEMPDPEAVMSSTDEHSQEIWQLIQENHSDLTDQQQRSLQACAELAVAEEGAAVDQAVAQCREEMEELAEEQQEQESEGGNAGEG